MKKTLTTKLIILSVFLILTFSLAYPSVSLAQDPSSGGLIPCGGDSQGPCTLCHFIIGFHGLVKYGLYLVLTLAFVALVFAGIMYAIAAGDEGMMTSAKGFLKATLIGFAVVFGGWLIIDSTLWVLSAKKSTDEGGTLGIKAVSWNTFTCSTASSALDSVTGPAAGDLTGTTPGGSTAIPGLGAACGNKNLGKCTAASTDSSATALSVCSSLGKTWIFGGTSCNSGMYCCGDKIGTGGSCVAMGGAQGTCQALYGTGGSDTTAKVCPNRSWRLQQPSNTELQCADTLGCCDMGAANANTALGIQGAACGPAGSDGTCVPGAITASCPSGKIRAGVTGKSCLGGLICCASPSTVPVNFSYDGITP